MTPSAPDDWAAEGQPAQSAASGDQPGRRTNGRQRFADGRISPAQHSPSGPSRWFVAQTVYRAMTIPWTVARATMRWQVSWLAGQGLMHGLPRPRMD